MGGMGKKLKIMLLTAAVLALGSGTALAGWVFTDLSLLGDIVGGSTAVKINNNGDIVGSAKFAGDGYDHAVLWSDGVAYNLGTFGNSSSASSINDDGVIVGGSYYPMGSELGTAQHAAIFSIDAPPVDILPESVYPNANMSLARDINNSGQIAGQVLSGFYIMEALLWSDPSAPSTVQVLDAGGLPAFIGHINNLGQAVGMIDVPFTEPYGYETYLHHAAFWDADGTLTDIGNFGRDSIAVGLNDLGQVLVQVVGESETGETSWSLVWQGGEVTEVLPGLGGDQINANAINNDGLIVGMAKTADGAEHAVLWQDGEIIDLNDLISGTDMVLSVAFDINEQGQIVGSGRMPDGTTLGREVAFLLTPDVTPTPIPASLLLFGSGLGGLGVFRRRFRQG